MKNNLKTKNFKNKISLIRVAIIILGIAALVRALIIVFQPSYRPSSANLVVETIPDRTEISVNRITSELIGKQAILEFRKKQLELLRGGLSTPSLSDSVTFARVNEGAAWQRYPEDPSLENAILTGLGNPLMLIVPADTQNRELTYSSLSIDPGSRSFSLSVSLNGRASIKDKSQNIFKLYSFNASDLGYAYGSISNSSTNIVMTPENAVPVPLFTFFGAVPGGCDGGECNGIVMASSLPDVTVTNFPAAVIINLFKEAPGEETPPEIQYNLYISN